MVLCEVTSLQKFSFPGGYGIDILNGPLPKNEFGCLAIFSVNPGGIRANHYHTDKDERVFPVSGHAKLVCVDVRSGEKEELVLNADEPLVVRIPAYVAHAYVNIGDEPFTAIFYGDKPHLENNPATVPYKVA